MNDEERKRAIIEWQDQLHDVFGYKGVLGGKFLSPTMELEGLAGKHFVKKFHGHRLLTDAFLDFYAETMQRQLSFHARAGWPTNEPYSQIWSLSRERYVNLNAI
jgi:hypothetical protein